MDANIPNADANQSDLNKLTIEQLLVIEKQNKHVLEVLPRSLETLNSTKERFMTSVNTLEDMQPESKNLTVMIPVTKSMCIPAVIPDANKYVVNIGAGYFCKKNHADALSFFHRRVEYVQTKVDLLEEIAVEKTNLAKMITNTIANKRRNLTKCYETLNALGNLKV